jgi:hypothetical protein
MVMTVNRVIEESDLAADEKQKAQRNLRRATPDEFDILYRLFEIPEARAVAGEIFRGGHVRICDKGARYDDWKSLPSADTRHSSHQSDGDQFHVDGPLSHTILFGRFSSWTWLQLESHPIQDVVSFFGHMIDYINYRRSGDNQGPYGASPHAEHNNPLVLPSPKPYVPIDRNSWQFKEPRKPRIPGQSPFR